jgi:Domain of unknown function (DUF4916)
MSFVDVVPVRRDGTGRLVGVGLIEVADADGRPRWTLIEGVDLPGESIDEAVERSVQASLGPEAHGHVAKVQPRWITDPGPGVDGTRTRGHAPRSSDEESCAAEISGSLQPQGPVQRFGWFLVTALPAQQEIAAGARSVLADFLDAEGEFGLAARLRQF